MDNLKKTSCFIIVLFLLLSALQVFGQGLVVGTNPNDCTGALLICGNTQIGITPDGAGINEFAEPGNKVPICYNFNADQAWFKVEVASDGTFQFVIEPDVPLADYDFAVFGPTADCSNLGPAIRCSSTNPIAAGVPGATGLNAASTDVNEGPNDLGDGFLRELDVKAGETYYIIVALAVGSGGFSLSVGGTTTFPNAVKANDVKDITECDNVDGIRDGIKDFDFSSLESQILNSQPNAEVSFYRTLNDANLGLNPITFPFRNTRTSQEIFYRVKSTISDCADFNSFSIQIDGKNVDEDPIYICSSNASENFDLATEIDRLVPNNGMFDISYYNSQGDAETDSNPVSSNITVTSTMRKAYILVSDPTGVLCDVVINVPLVLANPPVIAMPANLPVCDDDFDGFVTTDLKDQNAAILNGLDPANHTVNYYTGSVDRNAQRDAINNFSNTVNPQRLFARVTNNTTGCTADTDFQLVVNSIPILAPQADKIYCLNAINPLELIVEPGFAFYEWSTEESGATLNSIFISSPGDYTVVVTNGFGCESSLTITVNPSDNATIESIDVIDFQSGNNSVTINVSGIGDYEFAVDEGFFQDSPDFTGLDGGFHDFRVRDKNGCGTYRGQFSVLDFQPFFTPNADGFNDIWTLDALSDFPEARLLIYDRYGKLLKQILPGAVGWDGTFAGEPLPSSTYWYTLEVPGKTVVKGYFALKR
ncbi:T9SS type B sorting domain-containing protein [Nonlabens antarcticus]|uniref:T9SS type B sorting domain-containing protein n=1 Tax=Nonlabens antarcticus TaxID=392714 RepID=UPI001890D9CC|nr:T9SS type B sorting domain-containing protein [Nonlabens antarcticus]